MQRLYRPFDHGTILLEFALEWQDPEDIPGFLEWIRNMSLREFCWLVLGRIRPLEDLPTELSADKLETFTGAPPEEFPNAGRWYINFDWADDAEGFRTELLDCWEQFGTGVFAGEIESFRPLWDRSIASLEPVIRRVGYRAYYTEYCGKGELPGPLPVDMPYERITFIPSCRTPHAKPVVFFGYGQIKVILNCSIGPEDIDRFRELRSGLLTSFKALCDETRLRLLQQVALNQNAANGKWLSEKLKVSPSVVSRHLAQLKAAGFVDEYSEDNRNITYTLKMDQIRSLSRNLEAYLLSVMPEDIS